MENTDTIAPTPTNPSLESFRNKLKNLQQGQEITLSDSEIVVKVGRPSITSMIKEGKVPNNLVSIAMKLQSGNNNMNAEEAKQAIEFIDFAVHQAIIEPAGLTIEEVAALPEGDKSEIMNYIQGGMKTLEKFRSIRERADARLDLPPLPGKTTE